MTDCMRRETFANQTRGEISDFITPTYHHAVVGHSQSENFPKP